MKAVIIFKIFRKFFRKILKQILRLYNKIFFGVFLDRKPPRFFEKFWLGGAAPQTPRILAGGASPPQTPPLTGLAGGLPPPGSPAFFFTPLATRAPPGRPAGRPAERPPARLSRTRCASYDSEYDFTIPFFSRSHF